MVPELGIRFTVCFHCFCHPTSITSSISQERHGNEHPKSKHKQQELNGPKHSIDADQSVPKRAEKRSQRMQSLRDNSVGQARVGTLNAQTNRKGRPTPTSTAPSPPSTSQIARKDSARCLSLPAAAAASEDRRLSKPSYPTDGSVAESTRAAAPAPAAPYSPHDRQPSGPPSAGRRSLRTEAPDEDGEGSGDGDALDDVIRDPITLEVLLRARGRQRAEGMATQRADMAKARGRGR